MIKRFALLLCLGGAAGAQTMADLERRIAELEARLRALEATAAAAKPSAAAPEATAALTAPASLRAPGGSAAAPEATAALTAPASLRAPGASAAAVVATAALTAPASLRAPGGSAAAPEATAALTAPASLRAPGASAAAVEATAALTAPASLRAPGASAAAPEATAALTAPASLRTPGASAAAPEATAALTAPASLRTPGASAAAVVATAALRAPASLRATGASGAAPEATAQLRAPGASAAVPDATAVPPQPSPDEETRLPVAGYMDFHVNKDRGEPWRPDFHRFVLLFGHSFSERIKFWSELEVEHALVEGGEESGEVAVEQAYLDFLIKPYFNLRAGMMLTPVGIVNERHEPPSFNGVERPFVETVIIPTTWRELGAGVTGDLGRGFRYRAYLTSSLNASRFDAENGIAEGRTAGFDASLRNPAKVARVEYAGVRRLTLGASVYSGHAGFETPGVNPGVTIAEADGRFSFRRLDVRGLFANTWVSRAGELNQRLRQRFGVNPNVASQMRGYYFEPGVRVMPRRWRQDLIAFVRYEVFDTQHRMPAGYVALPQFQRRAWVTGLTFKPNADVAVKFDYVFQRNRSAVVRPVDGVNLGIGWWF